MTIDPDEDFASYYREGRDPDASSERLYLWHQALWASHGEHAERFTLAVRRVGMRYGLLLQTADERAIPLGSDSIIPTWSSPSWRRRHPVAVNAEIDRDADDFYRMACTIGGYVLFPRNRPGQKGLTLNQARGCRSRILDRFDLTLECIRRHYVDKTVDNPLGDRLAVYGDFFALFHGFQGYVSHFLLQDLVTEDAGAVRSLVTGRPLDDWESPALPQSAERYAAYREASLRFVRQRNERIKQRVYAAS